MSEYDLLKQQIDIMVKENDRRFSSLEESDKKSADLLGTIVTAIELIKQSSKQTNDTISRMEETVKDSIKTMNDRIDCEAEKAGKKIQTMDEKMKAIEKEPLDMYKKYKTTAATVIISVSLTAVLTALFSVILI